MYFWLKLFCLASIMDIIVLIRLPDKPEDLYLFSYITLGHSGFLISWERKELQKNKLARNPMFKFGYRIKHDETNENFTFSQTELSPNKKKIHSLKENTLYEVIIQDINYSGERPIDYSFEIKTKPKTNKKPAKPDFEWIADSRDAFGQIIKWYPCGKEMNCAGREAGTHFAIKLNPLDRRGECRIEEYVNDYYNKYFIPGILYEVTVISINNDFETESDPQEIFFQPMFGPVRAIKVELFPNATVLVSWKPPKYVKLAEVDDLIYSVIFSNSILNDYTVNKKDYEPSPNVRFEKPKYLLEPGKTYTASITPYIRFSKSVGMETLVKFTMPDDADDLFVNSQESVLLKTGAVP